MNRRDFLHTSAALGATALASSPTVAGDEPRRTLRAGLIGCGWYGMVDLRHLIREGGQQVEVASLCDVDSRHLRDSAAEVERLTRRRPQTFGDFRDMLRPRNLDIVLVGTPDHWHALATIAALEAGADVYVQKPLSHTYLEGQAMLRTARRLNRVVQVGTQRRSTPHIIQAREFIRGGALGRIGLVRAYCYYNMRGNQNPPNEDPPEYLDWNMWTGPAPMRPYNRLAHPKGWRKFNEYSNGILGDMGVHMLDVMRWVMNVNYPRRISSTGGIFVERGGKPNITDTQTVTYDYGDFTALWEHRTFGRADNPRKAWGVNFYGERGTVEITLADWEFIPHRGNARPRREEAVIVEGPSGRLEEANVVAGGRDHMRNFLECVRSRRRPVADIEEGHISTSLCTLGNVSQEVGRSLLWNAEREQVTGDEEANRHLRRAYRDPWQYPGT